ncbi:hypothetical protein GEMRC1_005138 [Eukaryota sp. GEM-RC1]
MNTCLIESGSVFVDFYQAPVVAGYLSPNVKQHLKPAFPPKILKNSQKHAGIALSLNVCSSLYPTDSAINLLMRTAAMIFSQSNRVMRIGALLSTSDNVVVVKFFPILLNLLSRALNSSRKSVQNNELKEPKTPTTPSTSRESVNIATSMAFKGFSNTLLRSSLFRFCVLLLPVAVVENGGSLLESFAFRHFQEDQNSSIAPQSNVVSLYVSLAVEWSKLLAKYEDSGDYSEPAVLSLHLSPFLYNLVAKSINLAYLNHQIINTSPLKSVIARLGIATRCFGKTIPNLAKTISSATSAFLVDVIPSLSVEAVDLANVFLRFLNKPFPPPLPTNSVSTYTLKNLFFRGFLDSSLYCFTCDSKEVRGILDGSLLKSCANSVHEFLTHNLTVFPIIGSIFQNVLLNNKDDCKDSVFFSRFVLNLVQTAFRVENDASLSDCDRQTSALSLSPFLLIVVDTDLHQQLSPLSESCIFFILWILKYLPGKLTEFIISNLTHVTTLALLRLFEQNLKLFGTDSCMSIIKERKFSEITTEAKAADFAKAIFNTYSGSNSGSFKVQPKFDISRRSQITSRSTGFNTISGSTPPIHASALDSAVKSGQVEITPAIRARTQSVTSYATISTALANTGRKRSNSIEKPITSDDTSSKVDDPSTRNSRFSSARFSLAFKRRSKEDSISPYSSSTEGSTFSNDIWYAGYLSQNICDILIKVLNIVSITVSSEKSFPKLEKSSRKNQIASDLSQIFFEALSLTDLSEQTFLSLFKIFQYLPLRHYSVIFSVTQESKLEGVFLNLLKYMNYRNSKLQRSAMSAVAIFLEVGFVLNKSNQVKRLLCKSLSSVLSDPSVEIKSNLGSILDELATKVNKSKRWVVLTTKLLKSIIHDTATLKEVQRSGTVDVYSESDLLYRLSLSNSDNQELELSWLEQLAAFYTKHSFFANTCVVYVKLASLVAPFELSSQSTTNTPIMTSLSQIAEISSPYSCSNFFGSISLPLDEEKQRSFNLFLSYIDNASAYAVLAGILPFVSTLFPLRLYLTSWLKPTEVPSILVDWKTAIEKCKSYRQNSFYLIRFRGKMAGDYENKNYIYVFPPLTKLPSVTAILTNAFSCPVSIKPGQKLPVNNEFRDDTIFIFVTEVFPSKKSDTGIPHGSDLNQVCFKKFEFQFPFTKDGSKLSNADPTPFPAARLRLLVDNFSEIEISPVGSAVEGLKKRIDAVESSFGQDPMVSQMVLQGAVAPQVSSGAFSYYQSFFVDSPGSFEGLDELRACFCELLSVCCQALLGNWTFIEGLKPHERNSSEMFHESLEDGWFKLYKLCKDEVSYQGPVYKRPSA